MSAVSQTVSSFAVGALHGSCDSRCKVHFAAETATRQSYAVMADVT